jgi:hypothetical protein
MTKRIIILVVLLLSLVSCKIEKLKDYKNLDPYIEVEKTNKEVFKEIDIEEYIFKLESEDSFICFFYSSSCLYCNKLIENIINPYIKKTNNIIFGIDVYNEKNYNLLDKIEQYQPNENDYFYREKEGFLIIRPITQIIEKGKIVEYERGYSKQVLDMIVGYIK